MVPYNKRSALLRALDAEPDATCTIAVEKRPSGQFCLRANGLDLDPTYKGQRVGNALRVVGSARGARIFSLSNALVPNTLARSG
jgi:hypothetical protein